MKEPTLVNQHNSLFKVCYYDERTLERKEGLGNPSCFRRSTRSLNSFTLSPLACRVHHVMRSASVGFRMSRRRMQVYCISVVGNKRKGKTNLTDLCITALVYKDTAHPPSLQTQTSRPKKFHPSHVHTQKTAARQPQQPAPSHHPSSPPPLLREKNSGASRIRNRAERQSSVLEQQIVAADAWMESCENCAFQFRVSSSIGL